MFSGILWTTTKIHLRKVLECIVSDIDVSIVSKHMWKCYIKIHIHAGMFCLRTFFQNTVLTLLRTPIVSDSHSKLGESAGGCLTLCEWLSVWCLVLWINHLHLHVGTHCGIWYVSLVWWRIDYFIMYIYKYISFIDHISTYAFRVLFSPFKSLIS